MSVSMLQHKGSMTITKVEDCIDLRKKIPQCLTYDHDVLLSKLDNFVFGSPTHHNNQVECLKFRFCFDNNFDYTSTFALTNDWSLELILSILSRDDKKIENERVLKLLSSISNNECSMQLDTILLKDPAFSDTTVKIFHSFGRKYFIDALLKSFDFTHEDCKSATYTLISMFFKLISNKVFDGSLIETFVIATEKNNVLLDYLYENLDTVPACCVMLLPAMANSYSFTDSEKATIVFKRILEVSKAKYLRTLLKEPVEPHESVYLVSLMAQCNQDDLVLFIESVLSLKSSTTKELVLTTMAHEILHDDYFIAKLLAADLSKTPKAKEWISRILELETDNELFTKWDFERHAPLIEYKNNNVIENSFILKSRPLTVRGLCMLLEADQVEMLKDIKRIRPLDVLTSFGHLIMTDIRTELSDNAREFVSECIKVANVNLSYQTITSMWDRHGKKHHKVLKTAFRDFLNNPSNLPSELQYKKEVVMLLELSDMTPRALMNFAKKDKIKTDLLKRISALD